MRLSGVNPIQAWSFRHHRRNLRCGLCCTRWFGGHGWSVATSSWSLVQHVTPGAFIAGMTLVKGCLQVVISLIKGTISGCPRDDAW